MISTKDSISDLREQLNRLEKRLGWFEEVFGAPPSHMNVGDTVIKEGGTREFVIQGFEYRGEPGQGKWWADLGTFWTRTSILVLVPESK